MVKSPWFLYQVMLVSGAMRELAGLAVIDNGRPVDRADTLHALRELGRAEDFERNDLK